MRVKGNMIPASVEIYLRGENAEVRLRENPREIDYELYEYDEYTLTVPDRPGLEQEISSNLSEWIKTARSTEVNPAASTVRAMEEDHLAELGIPQEQSFTATRRYTIGSFLSAFGEIYEVISIILNGAQIIPGSNVCKSSVEEYINKKSEE